MENMDWQITACGAELGNYIMSELSVFYIIAKCYQKICTTKSTHVALVTFKFVEV